MAKSKRNYLLIRRRPDGTRVVLATFAHPSRAHDRLESYKNQVGLEVIARFWFDAETKEETTP